MERIDIWVKTIVGIITSFISYMVEGLGLVFVVLLGLMLLDFVSGVCVAIVQKQLNSGIGTKGLIKKVHIIIVIGAVYLLEIAVLKTNGSVADGVSAAFCITEFISIVENGGKIGMPMPNKLKEIILSLKQQNNKTKNK